MDINEDVARHRDLDRAGRRIKVMVLVKAAPQPSKTYGDTVCVAGVAIEPGPPRWVRLYPVPFRYLDGEKQFSKYDIIDVKVRDAGTDTRHESLKIDAYSIRIQHHIKPWSRRAPWVEPLVGPSMCEVLDQVNNDIHATSLAAIRPRQATELGLSPHPGWSVEERTRFDIYAQQGDLFRETPPRLLDAPRLKAQLAYFCESTRCHGHAQRIIDWELNALQHNLRNASDEELRSAITDRFFRQMFCVRKATTDLRGQSRESSETPVLHRAGVYYPSVGEVPGDSVLF